MIKVGKTLFMWSYCKYVYEGEFLSLNIEVAKEPWYKIQ